MSAYVLSFQDIDKTRLMDAGGKGANLGELSKIDGISVPDGFCITTEALKRIIGETPSIHTLLEQLSLLKVEDRATISALTRAIRTEIEGVAIPADITDEITRSLYLFGEHDAFAVRSSATAEDLPTASFAGQQDTYLNSIGQEDILKHVSNCWASMFTDRAVLYRLQNGFDHRNVHLSVVVQKMVFPQVAGILFTADPITGHRKVVSIDASFGLGEAVVSGVVNVDIYKVRNGTIIDKKISTKKRAVYARKEGGTKEREIEPERQSSQALTDEQVLQLERIGRKIEEHFGRPQDIEWGLVEDAFSILQSRPITTLYPIPDAHDQENHVYVSVGHQQMMTDPMKPLGLSFFQLTAGRPMYAAGGRLFVDVAPDLASPARRAGVVDALGRLDPLIKDALLTIMRRGDFIDLLPEDQTEQRAGRGTRVVPPAGIRPQIENDPAIVTALIERSHRSIEELRQRIQTKSGSAVLDFILDDIQRLREGLADPRSMAAISGAMDGSFWINEKVLEWLGEKNAADTLSQSVSNNVTSEMGLALLDVADVIRPYPEVIEYLHQVKDGTFLDALVALNGGLETRDALSDFLSRYGMRCPGEIDVSRTRWSENPALLVPTLLSNIRNFEPGAGTRLVEHGRQEAVQKEQEILERLRQLPEGEKKADETKRMISLVRTFSGYREYPKYAIVTRYFLYKQALLQEAERLVQTSVMHDSEDIFYLHYEELREVVRSNTLDDQIIGQRKEEYKQFERLSPPRVITSDGEIIAGARRRDNLPPAALVGLAVSSGVAEGRARVILNMEDADLDDGDILVTSFTDPGWTPLFVSIKGLVTEVGGLMTHGAVIAREYGVPAVVGVEHATRLITDGQRIRVHGTDGYIEIL